MLFWFEVETPPTEEFNRLRISCSDCNQRMDVSDLEPFSKIQCVQCGAFLLVPKRLGRFMLLSPIGDGGMGTVYRAFDTVLKRQLAIKILREGLAKDPSLIENFAREARAAAELNHPNIAQFYLFGQENGQHFLAMELVDHGSLSDITGSKKKLTEPEVIAIGLQVASALRSAWAHGLVHHDIKPANILMDAEGNVKIVDFGLAQFAPGTAKEHAIGRLVGIWGTPEYIAPEKLDGQRGDFRSDMYSLGVTLYHLLAGRPPFEGTDADHVARRHLTETPPPVRNLRPDVSEKTAAVITRMLARKPEDRHKSYDQVIEDLEVAKGMVPRD